jgi:hypothetical protein
VIRGPAPERIARIPSTAIAVYAMSPLQIAVLKIIKANGGNFGWYRLDRALTAEKTDRK